MKKKNLLAILGIIILSAIVYFLVTVIGNEEKKANEKLTSLGETFYGYYYKEQKDSMKSDDFIKFISSYAATGFKISLKDLKIYLDGHKVESYNELKKCDDTKTRVTVYPVSPYKAENFKVELDMNCKFK